MDINVILIAVIVIVSFLAFNNVDLRAKLIHNPYLVNTKKQYYRLLSSGFIHADYMHLLFNMYALYLFGGVVSAYFKMMFGIKGDIFYLVLFISGVIIANIPDFISKKNMPYYSSLGASGGVSSIVFASIILAPLNKLMLFPIPIPMPAYIFALVYIAYSVYMNKRHADNINHMAHIWGGLWGVAFMALAYPTSIIGFIDQIKSSF